MNRFFICFAAITSSAIFTYSYWREIIGIKLLNEELVLLADHSEAPYFHASESAYMTVLHVFAILFTAIFLASIYFTYKKKYPFVMLCFVLSMLTIFLVTINGSIK